jgi:hypothetical protein
MTLVGRLISAIEPLQRIGGVDFDAVVLGEAHEGEGVGFAVNVRSSEGRGNRLGIPLRIRNRHVLGLLRRVESISCPGGFPWPQSAR